MEKALRKISEAIIRKANGKRKWPSGVYLDSEGGLWWRNRHWSFEELAKRIKEK